MYVAYMMFLRGVCLYDMHVMYFEPGMQCLQLSVIDAAVLFVSICRFFFSFGIFASSNGEIDSVICKLMKSACRLFVYQPDIGIGVVVV